MAITAARSGRLRLVLFVVALCGVVAVAVVLADVRSTASPFNQRYSPFTMVGPAPGAMTGVSCTSGGYCAAVGNWGGHAYVMDNATGVWTNPLARSVHSATAQGNGPQFTGVACWSPGNCLAVGSARLVRSGSAQLPINPNGIADYELGGRWSEPVPIYPHLLVEPLAVACTSHAVCVLGGIESVDGHDRVFFTAVTADRWETPRLESPPESAPDVRASCATHGLCVLVATYSRVTHPGGPGVVGAFYRQGSWIAALSASRSPWDATTACGGRSFCAIAATSGSSPVFDYLLNDGDVTRTATTFR